MEQKDQKQNKTIKSNNFVYLLIDQSNLVEVLFDYDEAKLERREDGGEKKNKQTHHPYLEILDQNNNQSDSKSIISQLEFRLNFSSIFDCNYY